MAESVIKNDNVKEKDVITTGITNATGSITFNKKHGVVTMSIDVSPTNANSNIGFTIPEKYRPIDSVYNQYTYNGNNIYIFFYPAGNVTIAHSTASGIIQTITFIANID